MLIDGYRFTYGTTYFVCPNRILVINNAVGLWYSNIRMTVWGGNYG